MRMLADNPSMDYLRREAKELLVALRETDADASLADAQRPSPRCTACGRGPT